MKKKVFREIYNKKLEETTRAREALEKKEKEVMDAFFASLEEEKPKKRGRRKSVKSSK